MTGYSPLHLRDLAECEQAHEALGTGEERLRSIIDRVDTGLLIMGSDGLIREWNPAAVRITGLERSEVIGRLGWEVHARMAGPGVDPAQLERVARAALLSAVQTGHSPLFGRPIESEITRGDGQVRRIQQLCFPTQMEGSFCLGFVIQDVTEQEWAATALRESEEHFRAIFEQGSVGIVTLDPELRIVRVNPAFCSMLGYEESELLGSSILRVTAPQDRERARAETLSVLAGERVAIETDILHVRKNGTVFWVHVSGALLSDGNGRPVGTLAVVQDISERKHMEDQLEASHAQLESAMDLAKLVNWEYDVASGMYTLNDRFYALNGTNVEREGGYRLTPKEYTERFVHPDDRHVVLEEMAKGLQATDPDYRAYVEFRIVRPDGEIRHLAVHGRATRDKDGVVTKAYGANEDITERKRTEAALAAAEERLRQAQKMEAIGQLAGGIAHDFNNLLTAIIGNSELALDHMPPDDALRPFVEDIKEVGGRAAGLTQQILAFSRRQMLKPEVVCLNDVVTKIQPMLERIIWESIEMETRLSDDLRLVEVDPGQMEQVLMNLAVNARDAMPDGGRLVIETANVELDATYCAVHSEVAPGSYAMLAVSDNGVGMDEETQRRAFEPFFTTKKQDKGTGLGLSTVFGIVEQSGGSIALDSTPGEGTSLRVYLPVSAAAAVSAREEVPRMDPVNGHETILVVEDERPVRQLVVRVLRRAGYDILEAGSGPEMEQVAGEGASVDLLLTDMVLPGGMSGSQVAARVRAGRPGLPVVFMSGYTQESSVFAGGGDHTVFLEKPFTPDLLLTTVRAALDGRGRQQAAEK